MTQLSPPSSLFGIPLAIRRSDAQQLAAALDRLWLRQMGRPRGAVSEDLNGLRTLFDPLARGERLRRLLATLPPVPAERSLLLRPPLVLDHDGESLITPEGRAALDVLLEALGQSTGDVIMISPDAMCAAEHLVYERYRQWSIRRLEDVLRLRAGRAEALRTPSIALLLLLLINGSRSPETAVRRLASPIDQSRLDGALGRILARFSDVLGMGDRDERHFSLYGGYPLTEARRRLPESLGPEPDAVYIRPGREERVLQLVASELRRPQRSPVASLVLSAFDRLVAAYRDELPTLAALGMAHEHRVETRELRERLEALLGEHNQCP